MQDMQQKLEMTAGRRYFGRNKWLFLKTEKQKILKLLPHGYNINFSKKCSKQIQNIHIVIHIWVKVFKNGPSKICGRQSLKNLNLYGLLTQILLAPFLNTLTHLLNPFHATGLFLYTLKHQKISGFLIFVGGTERDP